MYASVGAVDLQMSMSIDRRRKIAAVLTIVLWTMVGIATCVGLYFSNRLIQAPAIPDPVSGHVVPFNNHGKTVFITRLDDQMTTWGPLLAVVLCGLGWWIQRLKKDNGGAE